MSTSRLPEFKYSLTSVLLYSVLTLSLYLLQLDHWRLIRPQTTKPTFWQVLDDLKTRTKTYNQTRRMVVYPKHNILLFKYICFNGRRKKAIPVKNILSHLCSRSRSPTSGPPATTFTARSSKYSGRVSARNEEQDGTSSEGLRTTVFPAATAPMTGSSASAANRTEPTQQIRNETGHHLENRIDR